MRSIFRTKQSSPNLEPLYLIRDIDVIFLSIKKNYVLNVADMFKCMKGKVQTTCEREIM